MTTRLIQLTVPESVGHLTTSFFFVCTVPTVCDVYINMERYVWLKFEYLLHIPVPAVLGFVIVTTFPVYTKRKGVDPSRSVRISILRV